MGGTWWEGDQEGREGRGSRHKERGPPCVGPEAQAEAVVGVGAEGTKLGALASKGKSCLGMEVIGWVAWGWRDLLMEVHAMFLASWVN